MNIFFVFDEYTDYASPEVTRRYADILMDAIRNPFKPRPSGEVVLGVIAQEYDSLYYLANLNLTIDYRFWVLGVKSASNSAQKHFLENFKEYTDAVVQEAEYRQWHYIQNIEDYFDTRRLNAAIYVLHSMLELNYALPDEVFNHPTVVALRRLGCDMMIMDNVRRSSLYWSSCNIFTLHRTFLHITRSRHWKSIPLTFLLPSCMS